MSNNSTPQIGHDAFDCPGVMPVSTTTPPTQVKQSPTTSSHKDGDTGVMVQETSGAGGWNCDPRNPFTGSPSTERRNPFTGSPSTELRNPFTGSPTDPMRERITTATTITNGKQNKRLPPLQGDRHGHHERSSDESHGYKFQRGWSRPTRRIIDTQTPTSEIDSKIEDLMNMLECPVCLDTADKSPIYQCPEGHLLCETCNHKLTNCPQCGHQLVNSRNRTAEELAQKLQVLQGNRGRTTMFDQSIVISVSEPRKLKRGIFSPIVYSVNSKVKQETRTSSYSVNREYKEFLTIYNYLVATYTREGVIVPPPPSQNSLKTVATVASLSPEEDLSASSASQVIGSRCVALDRYLKRLVRHPVVKKDPNFRSFIQDKEMPKNLKTKSSLGDRMKAMLATFRSKMSVKEKDPWFVTRKNQLSEMSKQLEQMQNTLGSMSVLKLKLHHGSDQFRRDLVLMLVSRNSNRENHLGQVINEVVDCHRTMSTIYEQQSIADKLIVELAVDYTLLVESAMESLAQRRTLQMQLEKAEKKNNHAIKTKSDEVANLSSEEAQDEEKELQELQTRFESVSRTLRRELEHFDVVMKEEFEQAFSAYKLTYYRSLHGNNREFDNQDGIHDDHLQDVELYPSLPSE